MILSFMIVSMNNHNIVKGYKGIMDLDLSTTDPKYWKDMVAQHTEDINEYIADQSNRPIHLRYENTICRAEKILNADRAAIAQIAKDNWDANTRRHQLREEIDKHAKTQPNGITNTNSAT